jgi:hypothetical protein
MAIKTVTQRLEAIEAAIVESEAAIDAGVGNKRIIRERLATLYNERRRVHQEYLAEQNSADGGFFNKASF